MLPGHPDQGLRYELAGALGAFDVLTRLSDAFPDAPVIELDTPGVALLPVTDDFAAAVTPAALCALGLATLPGGTPYAQRRRTELLTGPESGFRVLSPGLAAMLEATSTRGPLAYVEADYYGREGTQAAALWRSGRLVWGPQLLGRQEVFDSQSAPLSLALKGLGVVAHGRQDEFVVAGLGRYRRTAEWAAAGSA